MNVLDLAEIAGRQPNISITITARELVEACRAIMEESLRMAELEMRRAPKDETVDRDTAMRLLGVTRQTLNRWDRTGYLHPVKSGGQNRFRIKDINDILNNKN